MTEQDILDMYNGKGAEEEKKEETQQEEHNSEEQEKETEEQDNTEENKEESSKEENQEGEEEEAKENEPFAVIKVQGKEIPVENKEKAIALMQQGMNFTQKSQKLSDDRKAMEAHIAEIEKEHQKKSFDYALLEKAKSGDKKALAYILKEAKIDPLDMMDIEADEDYIKTLQPTQKGVDNETTQKGFQIDDKVIELEEYLKENDPETLQKSLELGKNMPKELQVQLLSNGNSFLAFMNDVQSGRFEEVLTKMETEMAAMKPIDSFKTRQTAEGFLNLYATIYKDLYDKEEEKKPNKVAIQSGTTVKKKAAAKEQPKTDIRSDFKNRELFI